MSRVHPAPRPAIAFVWTAFGPYHVARCEAVARAADAKYQVIGIEVAPHTTTYAWERVPSSSRAFERLQLFDGVAEDVRPRDAFLRFRAALQRTKCAVAFLPSYWPAVNFALLAAAKSARVRAVMMSDSHAGTAQATGVRERVKRAAIRSFDAAVVGGTPHAKYFAGMGLPAARIFDGYDCVDNDYFGDRSDEARRNAAAIRAELGLPPRYVLSVGRMVAKKNLTSIVDAFAAMRCRTAGAPVSLVFVGDGEAKQILEDLVRRRALSVWDERSEPPGRAADVYLYRFRQIDDLPRFYALADAFVLASRADEWGLVVNEAMACGVPVIVSRGAGCAADLVRDGVNGRLFSADSVQELAGCLDAMFVDPAAAAAMGRAARRDIARWGCDRFAASALAAAETCLTP